MKHVGAWMLALATTVTTFLIVDISSSVIFPNLTGGPAVLVSFAAIVMAAYVGVRLLKRFSLV